MTEITKLFRKNIFDEIKKGCLIICRRKPTVFEFKGVDDDKFVTTYHNTKIFHLINFNKKLLSLKMKERQHYSLVRIKNF